GVDRVASSPQDVEADLGRLRLRADDARHGAKLIHLPARRGGRRRSRRVGTLPEELPGQLDREGAASAASRLDPDRAPMALHHPPGDRKPKAAARIAALEALEKARQ